MLDYGPHESTMIGEEVTLSKDPEIMADVVYRFDYQLTGSSQDFDVEVTNVEVAEIKNPIYAEDGSPVMMNAGNKQKYTQTAYNYFWKRLIEHAEEKAIDEIRLGRK